MTIGNREFSNFDDGGEATVGDIVVGLRDGVNTRFDFPDVFGPGDIIPIENGGTGADNITDARDNLGLGTMAVQDADAVAITGGTIIADDIKVGGIQLDNLGGISGVETLALEGATSGTITLIPEAIAGTNTITVPAATGTLALTSGIPSFPLSLANGGTNKSLVANNGGIFYSDADSGEILAGTATAAQMLQSGATAAPAWSTSTWPATTTINEILYSSSNNTVVGLASEADGVLITSALAVPSISSTLPSVVQGNITAVGTVASGTWNGSVIDGAYGGTGVNNGTATIQIADDVKFTGAFTFDGTVTGNTTVTFPTSGTLATTAQLPTLPLPLSDGGTNKSLTASNGGIFYSDADSGEILAGTITANQMLQSGSSAAPAWSTATWPAATTINQILYSSSANTVAGLATANDSVLITSGAGVPSFSSTLPTAVIGNIPGRLASIQILTSGTAATYTTPAGVTSILTICQGAGGGGGGVDSVLEQISCAGGGSGGGYCVKYFAVAAASYTYTVGAGGAGGTAGNNNGSAGTSTTFDTMTAGGGGGGGGSAGSAVAAMQGAGGVPAAATTGGDYNITGFTGGQGGGLLSYVKSGYGGAAVLGAGAPEITIVSSSSRPGIVGQNYGGGGSGAVAINDATDRAGGAGAQGLIIVYEYS